MTVIEWVVLVIVVGEGIVLVTLILLWLFTHLAAQKMYRDRREGKL